MAKCFVYLFHEIPCCQVIYVRLFIIVLITCCFCFFFLLFASFSKVGRMAYVCHKAALEGLPLFTAETVYIRCRLWQTVFTGLKVHFWGKSILKCFSGINTSFGSCCQPLDWPFCMALACLRFSLCSPWHSSFPAVLSDQAYLFSSSQYLAMMHSSIARVFFTLLLS